MALQSGNCMWLPDTKGVEQGRTAPEKQDNQGSATKLKGRARKEAREAAKASKETASNSTNIEPPPSVTKYTNTTHEYLQQAILLRLPKKPESRYQKVSCALLNAPLMPEDAVLHSFKRLVSTTRIAPQHLMYIFWSPGNGIERSASFSLSKSFSIEAKAGHIHSRSTKPSTGQSIRHSRCRGPG